MRSTHRLPFSFNPKVEHRNNRLRRLIKRGILKPLTKEQARKMLGEIEERAQNNSSSRHIH